MTGTVYIPSIVLKCPPGLIGAESHTIDSPGVTDTVSSLIVAKNILSAANSKGNIRISKSDVE